VVRYQKRVNGHRAAEEIFPLVISSWSTGQVAERARRRHQRHHRTNRQPICVDAISIYRAQDCKIAETWVAWDTFGFLQ
jgi:hypothetical protein